MTALTVARSGPRTTVQDLGRSGYQHQGLSPGGAADLRAFRWANHLLDNARNAACLEITFGGFAATADQPLLMAITGADCQAAVNGVPVPHWGIFAMNPGDRLQLDTPRSGLLTYLAVAGGWQTREFCNSRSCVVREGLTGLGPVEDGVTLPADKPPPGLDVEGYLQRVVPVDFRPADGADKTLKVIPGPDLSDFHHVDIARFIHSRYRIGEQSDRMGYRLEGPALASRGGVTSRGVCCGTVQVPGDGKPMVLLNDRQTIGGYPVLGTLPRLDCSRLAQKRPGESIGFRWSDVATCQSEHMLFERLLNTSAWRADGSLDCRWSEDWCG
ncbi:biotin-dependent carboxyltransferase family protein [Marinobacter zhanjiangensis]|uniref:Allophanate hydrolase n=1 Tax=Marinobacter zhanjiangensis TaxID=578215 RepID=A0ABQ3BB08_9GAMM|nr:biotin-dependent carboxyltransferase family protein [Marinobacter zhanjiangensis]GGY81938.1 allophanate hydrolase [Marinobacter zhanjiangensis]